MSIIERQQEMKETDLKYIGDGVYASFDGYQIWLRTERYGMIHEIALEPHVYMRVRAYGAERYSMAP